MGHLINPIGFRIGFFGNWMDLWTTSQNLIYAELIHNSIDYKKILAFYFENFVTDKYSIMYSHFTLEEKFFSKFNVNFYFYDGAVEQKIERFLQNIKELDKKKIYSYKRILRRFTKTQGRFFQVNYLKHWRYYDYILAKKIVLLLTMMINYGRLTTSRMLKSQIKKFYLENFEFIWFSVLKKNPAISLLSFLKCYVSLFVKAFKTELYEERRLVKFNTRPDFSFFYEFLHLIFTFWSQRHNYFRLLILAKKIKYCHKFKPFLNYFFSTNKFINLFFAGFYRMYLIKFRQARFFRVMRFIVSPILNRVGLLPSNLTFWGLDSDSITAYFLSRYIARKLEMRFRINELFSPIAKDLRFMIKNTSNIRGYKLQFTGRLTRRDRVRTTWTLGGAMPLNSIDKQIEHSVSLGILRNGICCVRVWLFRPVSFGNYNYNYRYKIRETYVKRKTNKILDD